MTANPDPAAPVAVLGGGAWGTALALLMAGNGYPVRLWCHRQEAVRHMIRTGRNERHLGEVALSEQIEPMAALGDAVADVQLVLIAVPSSVFPDLLDPLAAHLTTGTPVAWVTKGLGPDGLLGATVVRMLPAHPRAVLSGPSFAPEVARGLPTAVTLAAEDQDTADTLSAALQNRRFRVYTSRDLAGVQIGGAVKNVIAIATGIADTLALGANARAGLMTRGLAEIRRLGVALGAEDETFSGLAGMGDLVLTCTDDQSRNRQYGLALGRGEAGVGAVTVEGASAAERVLGLARENRIEMPISEQVAAVVAGRTAPTEAVDALMARGLPRLGGR